jgi:alkylation response protein AidB-like acyl-CoA dehydrogenase
MDLSLTEKQEMLKASAREMVEREFSKDALVKMDTNSGFTSSDWKKIADLGWAGLLVPDEFGGEGGSLTDAAVLFEELGRGPVPGPNFSSAILGTLAVLEGATPEQKMSLLPRLAVGATVVLAPAITESDYGWSVSQIQMKAAKRNGSYTLNGVKTFVQDAIGATHLLCTARLGSGQIGLFVVDTKSPGVSLRPLPGFTTGVCEVRFDRVIVHESNLLGEGREDGWDVLQRVLQKAIPILCAYQVGGSEKVFEMSLEYANTRVQFGMVIGRFQRVQDHVIEQVNQLDAARWATYEALWKLDTGQPAAASVHMAKALASEAYYQVCNAAHEVHAGLGIMREYGLYLHTKMSRTLYHYLGDPKFHKSLLTDALEAQGVI